MVGLMKKLSIILLFVFALPSLAFANTYTAASCFPVDVQYAVNAALDGDTIVIPSGSCTWADGGVVIPDNKSIEIIGPGARLIYFIPERIREFKFQSQTATNTWTAYNTPDTYHHPLTQYATVSSLSATPTNLAINAVSSSQIIMSWTDNSGNESGFRIERCSGSACSNFAQIASVGANFNIYSDSGLPASAVYSYRVRAYNAAGNSGYSNTATETTLHEDSQGYGLYSRIGTARTQLNTVHATGMAAN
jgi:hypothetical protein